MAGEKDNKTKVGGSAVPPPPPPPGSSFHGHQSAIVSIINNSALKSEDKLKNYDEISHNINHDDSLDSQIKERLMSMITQAKISVESAVSELSESDIPEPILTEKKPIGIHTGNHERKAVPEVSVEDIPEPILTEKKPIGIHTGNHERKAVPEVSVEDIPEPILTEKKPIGIHTGNHERKAAPKGRIAEMHARLSEIQQGRGASPILSSESPEIEQPPGKLAQKVALDLGAMLANRKPPKPSKPSVASDVSTAASSSEQSVPPKGPPAFLAGITGGANLKKTEKVTSSQTLSQKPVGPVPRNLAEAAVAGRAGLKRREVAQDNKPQTEAPLNELQKKLAARRAKEIVAEVREEGKKADGSVNENDTPNNMKP